jgi:hypothetical protein
MTNLYRDESSKPKWNAQRNLCGRTHYVDDETLRWHKSRVLSARHTDEGLLFAIVESLALDMNNTKRGYRYTIFDVFGNTVDRLTLEESFRTSTQATKAMWTALNEIDAKAITLAAIDRASKYHADEMNALKTVVTGISTASREAAYRYVIFDLGHPTNPLRLTHQRPPSGTKSNPRGKRP